MSHFNDIEALLRKNKNQNSEEIIVYYFLRKPRFTYNSIKLVTNTNNYCNLYYSTSERPNNIRAFLYST